MDNLHSLEHTATWHLGGGLKVTLAQLAEAKAILALWEEADRWMLERGIVPGSAPRPLIDIIRERIEGGESYSARQTGPESDTIVGTITLQWADDGLWGDGHAGDACYVHGLATRRALAGHGIGLALLAWAEGMAVARGRSSLRLDCDADNPALCSYYQRAGLTPSGSVMTAHYRASRFEKRVAPHPV